MTGSAIDLHVGARLMLSTGPAVVAALERHGVCVKTATGAEEHIRWDHLTVQPVTADGIAAIHTALEPWWSSLDEAIQRETMVKLEVVLEVLTGYRDGIPELAHEGEPFYPFGEAFGVSVTRRTKAMARQLSFERGADRSLIRRVRAGELQSTTVSDLTVRLWIRSYRKEGLRGLVDGRKTRGKQGFDALDPRFMRIAEEEFAVFDGGRSGVNLVEIERRILVRLKEAGATDVHLPQRLMQQYLSSRQAALGTTTRGHKSAKMRQRSGHRNYPDVHPGHLATDVTRADNLVRDTVGRPISVEIISVISVPTRVIVACRVVPQSADAVEAGLALYDAMRPFSMVVEGTTINDFRWCGIPASLSFAPFPPQSPTPHLKTDREVEGTHIKPGVAPKSLRADNGSIFLSEHLRRILAEFGVDALPSRVGRPLDNAHIERWHETLQAAYQAVPGFKGRHVRERGRYVGTTADEPLLSARELQQHLHRFIALDYHRNHHSGLVVPDLEDVKLTPLEMFDIRSETTGRLLVPQHPDLLYQFLPVRWLTPGNGGVTYRHLTYDGPIVDELRGLRPRTFRDKDDKIPFLIDPRDRNRIWHRSRLDDRVHELVWRDSHLVHAPMTDWVVSRAAELMNARGGNAALSRRKTMREIVEAITVLTSPGGAEEWHTQLGRAHIRHEQALIDHAEAAAAAATDDDRVAPVIPLRADAPGEPSLATAGEPWPDYDQVGD
ncbi:hypothetical protein [Flexivirga sp. B27]